MLASALRGFARRALAEELRVSRAGCSAALQLAERRWQSTGRSRSSTDKNFSLEDVLSSSEDEAAGAAAPSRPAARAGGRARGGRFGASAAGGRTGGRNGAPSLSDKLDASASESESEFNSDGDFDEAGEGSSGSDADGADAAAAAPRLRTLGSDVRHKFKASGPVISAVVDADGDILPLEAAGRKGLPGVPLTHMTPAEKREALTQFLYYRRKVRATYDSDELDDFASAAARELGSDLDETDIEDITRDDDWVARDDPLRRTALPLDITALSWSSNITLDQSPGKNKLDRKATIWCKVNELGISPPVRPYFRKIAGPHYNPESDVLKMTLDKHADPAMNRREAIERLVAMVHAGAKLYKKHGEFKAERRYTPYYH